MNATLEPTVATKPYTGRELLAAVIRHKVAKLDPKRITDAALNETVEGYFLPKYTALTAMAEYGELKHLPEKFLTIENLLIWNDGSDCFQIAALHGHLDQIPAQLLTKENLSRPNFNGTSAIDRAILKGYSKMIPKGFLTVDLFIQPSLKPERTRFYSLAWRGHINQIEPDETFVPHYDTIMADFNAAEIGFNDENKVLPEVYGSLMFEGEMTYDENVIEKKVRQAKMHAWIEKFNKLANK